MPKVRRLDQLPQVLAPGREAFFYLRKGVYAEPALIARLQAEGRLVAESNCGLLYALSNP